MCDDAERLTKAWQQIGHFAGVIDMSLLDFKYKQNKRGIARLQKALDDYRAARDADLVRLGLKTAPVTA